MLRNYWPSCSGLCSYEEKIHDLKNKISELCDEKPNLSLGFWSGNEITDNLNIFVSNELDEIDIDKNIEIEEKEVKRLYNQPNSQIPIPKNIHYANTYFDVMNPNKTKEEYFKDCDEYLISYRKYLELKKFYILQVARLRKIKFAIKNIGNSPAENIFVFIDFPNDLILKDRFITFIGKRIFNKPPKPPKRPDLRKSLIPESLYLTLTTVSDYPLESCSINDLTTRNVHGPFFEPKNSTEVRFEINKLMHNFSEQSLNEILVFSPDDSINKEFELNVTIHADNLPNPVKETLVLKIKGE